MTTTSLASGVCGILIESGDLKLQQGRLYSSNYLCLISIPSACWSSARSVLPSYRSSSMAVAEAMRSVSFKSKEKSSSTSSPSVHHIQGPLAQFILCLVSVFEGTFGIVLFLSNPPGIFRDPLAGFQ